MSAALDTSGRLGATAFVTCQDEYSLLVRKIERDLMPIMLKRGMTLLPYAPLAGGFLSGKYVHGKPLPKTRASPTAATMPPTSSTSGTGNCRSGSVTSPPGADAACSTSRSAGCWRGR